jgi:hypothetical protein
LDDLARKIRALKESGKGLALLDVEKQLHH